MTKDLSEIKKIFDEYARSKGYSPRNLTEQQILECALNVGWQLGFEEGVESMSQVMGGMLGSE